MCVSATMLEAGGHLVQGYSDYQTGKSQAKVALYEGRQAVEAGNYDASLIRRKGAEVQGSNIDAAAAAGVDPNSGSALEIAAKNARDSELDSLMAINQGQKVNWAKGVEAKQAKYKGKMSLINQGMQAYASIEKGVVNAVSGGMGG